MRKDEAIAALETSLAQQRAAAQQAAAQLAEALQAARDAEARAGEALDGKAALRGELAAAATRHDAELTHLRWALRLVLP